jgi:hypothetical protein
VATGIEDLPPVTRDGGIVELSDCSGFPVEATPDPVPVAMKAVELAPVGVREPRPRASSVLEKFLDGEGEMLGAVTPVPGSALELTVGTGILTEPYPVGIE